MISTDYSACKVFADDVLGPSAVVVFSLMIAASCLGALNANVYATATLCVAASHRGYFPSILGTKPSTFFRTGAPNRRDTGGDGVDLSVTKVPT
jgi:hypothetical protein